MTKHMKLLWVAGAILLAVGGAAMASNMGFKFVPNIATHDPDIYPISIPFNNNYPTLSSIFNDISASPGCTAASVALFAADQSSCTWTGGFTCDAPYPSGRGVIVTVSAGCTGWVIVGSHNPSQVINFPVPDPGIQDVSVPYHTTQTDIAGLFAEIPNAASVGIFNPDQSSCVWTGNFTCNTALQIGTGVRVTVSVAGTNWTPSHY
jgi:hypothetical protein